MSDEDLLHEISRKLSILISLELQRDGDKSVQANVARLNQFGLSGIEIANILGTTIGTVAVAKNRIKKKAK